MGHCIDSILIIMNDLFDIYSDSFEDQLLL